MTHFTSAAVAAAGLVACIACGGAGALDDAEGPPPAPASSATASPAASQSAQSTTAATATPAGPGRAHDGHAHPAGPSAATELQHSHRAHEREHGHAHDADVTRLVGHPAPPWTLSQWFNSPPRTIESLRGSVVLARWFMSPDCPHCSATAPSLNTFHQRYRDRGLAVVGLYHHKSEEPLDPEDVKGYIAHYGFEFPVAIDADWRTLKAWWLDHHDRSFTSVSFLLDRAGVIRHVHLGGTYREGDADFVDIDRRIRELLAEPAPE